jgi:hypothetical protein
MFGVRLSPSHGCPSASSTGAACGLAVLVVALYAGIGEARAVNLIFADGFESGTTGAWGADGSGVPPGLPPRLGLGLANNPQQLGWMSGSGTPWDYRYQYLSAGVNTGYGWSTWNSPPGAFATYYIEASESAGFIPVLTYYNIVQSNPNPGVEPPTGNLNNSATMSAYFADWKLLMQRVGAAATPVIVHHEPDLWGYLQYDYGDDPSAAPVAVASSSFPEAATFSNNARGFAKALVALRDTYAPNAILAFHASAWSTGVDLTYNNADGGELGARVATFFNALEADFELIFTDPDDRDSGYNEHVLGDGGASWWDAADFDRFLDFVAAIHEATGRPSMLWQVPNGNTLYRTCNNTAGHYQDNRPEFFLAGGNRQHLIDFANAGTIGILFGRGIGGATAYDDDQGDGVTNPAPVNGNSLVSQHSDDDGGFLRLQAAAYYAAGPVVSP